MSEPNKKDSRKVSIILPPDGDHGNEEEETNGVHCNVLNLESDTTSNRRRQSWANANKRKQSIISENGGYKRKQSAARVLSECLHVDIGEGHSKLNYRISQNPPFHLTIFFALQVSVNYLLDQLSRDTLLLIYHSEALFVIKYAVMSTYLNMFFHSTKLYYYFKIL